MPKIESLKKHLDKGELLPLYVIYGEEKHDVRRAAARLVSKADGGAFTEFNLNEFNSDATVDAIADAALALPFMAECKCVTVSDFDVDALDSVETGKLAELLDDLSESTVLVFHYPTLNMDMKKAKWKNFFKKAEKVGGVICYGKREVSDLIRWLCTEAERGGSALSKRGAEKIIEYVGRDMTYLKNELDKLSAFAKGREISMDDIESMVTKNTETNVFRLSDAIIRGDYDTAYSILDYLFYMKEEAIVILSSLSGAYINIARVKAALKSGKDNLGPTEYDPTYKGKEFLLRNAQRDARNISDEALSSCLDILLETDLKLKSSKADDRLLLEELIAKLLVATRGNSAGGRR